MGEGGIRLNGFGEGAFSPLFGVLFINNMTLKKESPKNMSIEEGGPRKEHWNYPGGA